jgi:hypothetical protein
MSQPPQRLPIAMQKDVIFETFFDLEALVQEYRKAVFWLIYGNHDAMPHPTAQETRELMKLFKEKITYLLDMIEAKTQ